MTSNNIKKIKKIIKEFFKKMTFELDIEFLSPKDQTFFVNLKIAEPQILIGEKGQTLSEIQHLLNIILRKQIKEVFYINLDINGYKDKKTRYLKEMARSSADEVALSKKEKWLPSMPAYERRIIHLELAERKDVTTESIGQEPERRVVIRPYS
jgi:spoIIIJ-associated protein